MPAMHHISDPDEMASELSDELASELASEVASEMANEVELGQLVANSGVWWMQRIPLNRLEEVGC